MQGDRWDVLLDVGGHVGVFMRDGGGWGESVTLKPPSCCSF